MAREELVDIVSVVFREDLYPRVSEDWQIVAKYKDALKIGAVFPAIEVAAREGILILIDGRHRLSSHKAAGRTQILASMEMGLSDGEIFARALKANSFHGRNLSVQERTAGFKRLREEFHFSTEDVQNILQTPIERLEHWNATRGIELKAEGAAAMLDASIFDSVRKAPLAEMNIPEGKLHAIQENIAARDQRQIFRSAVSIVESGLLDRSDLELLGLVERLGVAISKLKLKRKIPA